MAYQHEVDKINELCDEIEVMVDEMRGMLPEEATEDFDVDAKLNAIRRETSDIEDYVEIDPDDIINDIDMIISAAQNVRDNL